MAIPDNYIDHFNKDGDKRYISPAADKVRVDNENFEGSDLDEVLDEISESIGEAGQVNEIIMNGEHYTPTNKVIDLGTVITQHQDISAKVDKVTGKGLSTNDYTNEDKAAVATIANKANSTDVYTKSQTYSKSEMDALLQDVDVDLTDYYDKDEVDNAISEMEATIEQQQLIVITGGKLSLWLDEDGESINIMAGAVPDIAASPTISHVINNDGTATVTIATTEQGATIYYTTNGDTPTESSSVYNSALTINTAGSHTIKAIAVVQDKMKSSVATDTFSVVSCQTPVIAVDNSDRNQAVVTATAGSGESVSLSVGGQTATGTGSASVTINKTTSSQTLSASSTATATGKLTTTATQNVTIEEKVAYVFSAHSIGGKAVSGTSQGDILLTLNSNFKNQAATITEEDGVVWWEIDLQGQLYNGSGGYSLYNLVSPTSSIFSSGSDKVLTIEHIPEECTLIKDINVFAGCTALTMFKVAHTSALTSINRSLASKSALETVVLPPSVTSIGMAFQSCSALTSIVASGVVSIGEASFSNCQLLESASFGTITSVGKNAFLNCYILDFDGVDFSHATSFGIGAFSGCKALTSIVFNSTITSIPDSMCYDCITLSSVTLPSSLTSIGASAFKNCSALKNIDIPAGITSFAYAAFQFSGVNSANGTATIRKEAQTTSDVPTRSWENEFASASHIYVPSNSVTSYQSAWANCASKISAIS